MNYVLLVRHAQPANPKDDMSPLSVTGRVEAVRLSQLLADLSLEAVYSSPYPRARQTVEPLAARRNLAVCEVADLRERALGSTTFDDFDAAVRATWDDFDFVHPGGESNAAAQQRIVEAHERVLAAHPRGGAVIATHGNVLTLLLRHYDPSIGFAFWQSLTWPDVYRLWPTRPRRTNLERLWKP